MYRLHTYVMWRRTYTIINTTGRGFQAHSPSSRACSSSTQRSPSRKGPFPYLPSVRQCGPSESSVYTSTFWKNGVWMTTSCPQIAQCSGMVIQWEAEMLKQPGRVVLRLEMVWLDRSHWVDEHIKKSQQAFLIFTSVRRREVYVLMGKYVWTRSFTVISYK